jgi:hypothetical protein
MRKLGIAVALALVFFATGALVAQTTVITSFKAPLIGNLGGTGIANSGKTIALGGNLVTGGALSTSGAHALILTLTGDTNVTLPTSGTLAIRSGDTFSNPTITGSLTATGLVTNADLANPATTVNGQTCTLGSTCTITASVGSVSVGGTAITSGTDGRVFSQAGGVLAQLSTTGSGNVVLGTSPTLSGTPTAPTAAPSTNSSQLATTAYADAAVAAVSGFTIAPQGRLTLTSNTPVMTADVSAATTIYLDTFKGRLEPVGGVSLPIGGDQISMGLDAGVPHAAANSVYDIWAINNAGTLVIAIGPAWINTATVTTTVATPCVVTWTGHGLPEGAPVVFTGAGLPSGITAGTTYFVGRSPAANTFNISTTVANAAAGTFVATTGTSTGTQTGTNNTTLPAGRFSATSTTAQLAYSSGVLTNAATLTHAWGGASGTTDYGPISTNAATYRGSVYITANGQTEMTINPTSAGGGANNKLGLYNAYNQVNLLAMNADSTASWTYATGAWQSLDNSVSNRITYVDGLGMAPAIGTLNLTAGVNTGTATDVFIGAFFDTTLTQGTNLFGEILLSSTNNRATAITRNRQIGAGLHYVQAVQFTNLATGKFYGGGLEVLTLDFLN